MQFSLKHIFLHKVKNAIFGKLPHDWGNINQTQNDHWTSKTCLKLLQNWLNERGPDKIVGVALIITI